jgi:serine phosphatase RsbU (regulator of sigma subunit)/pSer/pThr/pTyr-binding forkhead associated (FHA) protein
MAQLIFTRGVRSGQVCPLGEVTVIGRSPEADITLRDATVSRHHARIVRRGGKHVLCDLESGNGTFVNGKLIKEVALRSGDQIKICGNVAIFHEETEADAPPDVRLVEDAGRGPEVLNTITIDLSALTGRSGVATTQEELLRINKRLRILTELSQEIGVGLDERRLFEKILSRLFQIFPQADRGFILVLDPEERKLKPRAVKTRGESGPQEIQMSRTIIRTVIDNRQAVLSTDAMGDRRFRAGESISHFRIRSVMCAPLTAKREILGIIHLDSRRSGFCFGPDDLALLAGIAAQAGLVVANARLHARLLERSRMLQDLQYARRIQEGFLPTAAPEISGLLLAHCYRAAREVGGDFFNYIPLPDGRLGIVIGDVAGKGVSAALLMARMSSDLRYLAATNLEPARILSAVNAEFMKAQMGEAFVTVLFLVYDPRTRELTLSNAGHPPPLLARAHGEVTRITEAASFPIGFLEDAPFEQSVLVLAPGDRLCAYTDGVVEALNVEKETFGAERLVEALNPAEPSPDAAVQGIMARLESFTAGAPQSDDITLILAQVGHTPDR